MSTRVGTGRSGGGEGWEGLVSTVGVDRRGQGEEYNA